MPAGRTYRETLDQPAMTSLFDLDEARSAPSFDKLWRDVESLLSIGRQEAGRASIQRLLAFRGSSSRDRR